MEKVCTKCGRTRNIAEFCKNKTQSDGYNYVCKKCAKDAHAEWYKINSDAVKKDVLEWQLKNPSKAKSYRTRWDSQNASRRQTTNSLWYLNNINHHKYRTSKWRKENPEKIAYYSGKHRAAKLMAMPNWLNSSQLKAMKQFYSTAKRLSGQSLQKYEVDHIVPLQGKNVSGLHVPWNLQIITESDNRRKSNKV